MCYIISYISAGVVGLYVVVLRVESRLSPESVIATYRQTHLCHRQANIRPPLLLFFLVLREIINLKGFITFHVVKSQREDQSA